MRPSHGARIRRDEHTRLKAVGLDVRSNDRREKVKWERMRAQSRDPTPLDGTLK